MDWYFIFIIGLSLYWGCKGRVNRAEDKRNVITVSDVQLVTGIIGVIILLLDL